MQTRGPPRASGPRGAASSQASAPTALPEASGVQGGSHMGACGWVSGEQHFLCPAGSFSKVNHQADLKAIKTFN